MASAKQLAARRKFAQIMKSGGFKKRKRLISRASHNPPMARRRGSRTRTVIMRARGGFRKRGGARGMLGSASGLFKMAALGIGGGMVASEIASRVFPQAAPIAGIAGSYIAGGMKGVIANVAFDAITGREGILAGLGGLGGMFGGNGGVSGDSL